MAERLKSIPELENKWPFYSVKALATIGAILLFAPAVYWYFAWGAGISVALHAGAISWLGILMGLFAAACIGFVGILIMVGLPPVIPGGIMNSDGTTSNTGVIIGLIFALLLLVLVVGLFICIAHDFAYASVANDFFGAGLTEWNLGCSK